MCVCVDGVDRVLVCLLESVFDVCLLVIERRGDAITLLFLVMLDLSR